MKRKLATMAIVGAMAVTAVAPATVFAATDQTTVQYVKGAVVPEGADGSYYVLVPADITFTDNMKTGSQNLYLRSTAGGEELSDLNPSLSVSVSVKSANAMTLTSGSYAALNYSLNFDSSYPVTDGNDTEIGTLTINDKDILGTAELTTDTADIEAPKGTIFKDTLTYTITQTTP